MENHTFLLARIISYINLFLFYKTENRVAVRGDPRLHLNTSALAVPLSASLRTWESLQAASPWEHSQSVFCLGSEWNCLCRISSLELVLVLPLKGKGVLVTGGLSSTLG